MNETDPRFYVAPSTIPGAGRGLFASVPLEAGAKLAVLGVLIERGSLADECTQFADAHKMRVGESGLMIPLGFAGMVNHSLDPNVEKQVEGTTLYLCTLRPIAAHEELFYTYSDYARDRFGLD